MQPCIGPIDTVPNHAGTSTSIKKSTEPHEIVDFEFAIQIIHIL